MFILYTVVVSCTVVLASNASSDKFNIRATFEKLSTTKIDFDILKCMVIIIGLIDILLTFGTATIIYVLFVILRKYPEIMIYGCAKFNISKIEQFIDRWVGHQYNRPIDQFTINYLINNKYKKLCHQIECSFDYPGWQSDLDMLYD